MNQIVEKLKLLKANVEADLKQDIQNVLLAVPSVECRIDNVANSLELDPNQPISHANIKQLFRTHFPNIRLLYLYYIEQSFACQ